MDDLMDTNRVDRVLRDAGYCGLVVEETKTLRCMLLAAHDTDEHYDSVEDTHFTAALTDEERRVPVTITGAVDPTTREPTKQREGDQTLPSGDVSLEDDQSLLIQDIEWRRQVGIARYGQGHRPFNGRDTLLDAYEELLDLLVYTRSLRRMSEATREELIKAVAKAFHPVPDGEDEATAAIAVDRIMGWVATNNEAEGLDFDALRVMNVHRCRRWHGADSEPWTGADWATAFGGETGEALNVVKKLRRLETAVTLGPIDETDRDKLIADLADELADTVTYADLLADHYDIDLGAAVAEKFNRVSERQGFPERLKEKK